MTDQRESALFEQAAQGDTQALRALLEAHGAQVWRNIDGQIGQVWRSSIDADDVMQVTYMEAFLQAGQMTARNSAAFVAWLRRIAENNLRDAIKELQRKKRPDPAKRANPAAGQDSYVALIDMLGATSATPSRHAARNEAKRILELVLEKLPEDYRTVVRLYDLEGLSIGDVAARLSRSSGAVHMLRARAHDRLKHLLGSEGDFFSHAP